MTSEIINIIMTKGLEIVKYNQKALLNIHVNPKVTDCKAANKYQSVTTSCCENVDVVF